ncbi:hypothetical protein K438DRAFT_2031632 [Mycena galopus ATCC 62051]|nr:hypothetical protein K438DRAFT_2031632 [Mycena galopus ATCC 62051]
MGLHRRAFAHRPTPAPQPTPSQLAFQARLHLHCAPLVKGRNREEDIGGRLACTGGEPVLVSPRSMYLSLQRSALRRGGVSCPMSMTKSTHLGTVLKKWKEAVSLPFLTCSRFPSSFPGGPEFAHDVPAPAHLSLALLLAVHDGDPEPPSPSVMSIECTRPCSDIPFTERRLDI